MNIQANQLSTLTPTGFERGNEIVRVRASQDNVGLQNLDIQAACTLRFNSIHIRVVFGHV